MSNIGANRDASTDKDEELKAIASNLLSTEDTWRQKVCVNWYFKTCQLHTEKCVLKKQGEYLPSVSLQECESVVTLNMDLAALVQGSVKRRKAKPPSTKETKKEAFDRYMKIIYGLPPNIKVSRTHRLLENKLYNQLTFHLSFNTLWQLLCASAYRFNRTLICGYAGETQY